MLSDLEIHATIPTKDMDRARRFYERTLGLGAGKEVPGGMVYRSANSCFLLYPTPYAGTAQHTLMGWQTPDIKREVADLKAKGVVFEEYDMPQLKTVDGIATTGPTKAAWFKDPDGNILGLVQLPWQPR